MKVITRLHDCFVIIHFTDMCFFYDTEMEQETRQDNHQEEAVCMHVLYLVIYVVDVKVSSNVLC
jgi:hypothetical protein